MGNGTNISCTCLDFISQEALHAIQSAGVILAKRQGNFETLYRCGLNIYYLFMCKCNLFTNRFHKKLYEGMLIIDKDT